jgi:hypothetical protein
MFKTYVNLTNEGGEKQFFQKMRIEFYQRIKRIELPMLNPGRPEKGHNFYKGQLR